MGDFDIAGCWAHVRRKFDQALKAHGGKKTGHAHTALRMIQELYRIEKALREEHASPERRVEVRQHQARPQLDKIRNWAMHLTPHVPPKSPLGKALNDMLNQWNKLERDCDNGHLPIDNNGTENAIRPFVVGRKNWQFADTPAGARASANIDSLLLTAKAHGVPICEYLAAVLQKLPLGTAEPDLEALLPWNVGPGLQRVQA